MESHFEYEHLQEIRRTQSGSLEVLIKWKGYPRRNSTWEPIENLGSQEEQLTELEDLELRLLKGYNFKGKALCRKLAKEVVQSLKVAIEQNKTSKPSTSRSPDRSKKWKDQSDKGKKQSEVSSSPNKNLDKHRSQDLETESRKEYSKQMSPSKRSSSRAVVGKSRNVKSGKLTPSRGDPPPILLRSSSSTDNLQQFEEELAKHLVEETVCSACIPKRRRKNDCPQNHAKENPALANPSHQTNGNGKSAARPEYSKKNNGLNQGEMPKKIKDIKFKIISPLLQEKNQSDLSADILDQNCGDRSRSKQVIIKPVKFKNAKFRTSSQNEESPALLNESEKVQFAEKRPDLTHRKKIEQDKWIEKSKRKSMSSDKFKPFNRQDLESDQDRSTNQPDLALEGVDGRRVYYFQEYDSELIDFVLQPCKIPPGTKIPENPPFIIEDYTGCPSILIDGTWFSLEEIWLYDPEESMRVAELILKSLADKLTEFSSFAFILEAKLKRAVHN